MPRKLKPREGLPRTHITLTPEHLDLLGQLENVSPHVTRARWLKLGLDRGLEAVLEEVRATPRDEPEPVDPVRLIGHDDTIPAFEPPAQVALDDSYADGGPGLSSDVPHELAVGRTWTLPMPEVDVVIDPVETTSRELVMVINSPHHQELSVSSEGASTSNGEDVRGVSHVGWTNTTAGTSEGDENPSEPADQSTPMSPDDTSWLDDMLSQV
jgi:hypothetical protein